MGSDIGHSILRLMENLSKLLSEDFSKLSPDNYDAVALAFLSRVWDVLSSKDEDIAHALAKHRYWFEQAVEQYRPKKVRSKDAIALDAALDQRVTTIVTDAKTDIDAANAKKDTATADKRAIQRDEALVAVFKNRLDPIRDSLIPGAAKSEAALEHPDEDMQDE